MAGGANMGGSNGYARAIKYDGSAWVIRGSNLEGAGSSDQFGDSVSLSQDGSVFAIGGRNNDGYKQNAGHVQVYEWNAGRSSWSQLGSDIYGEAKNDESGFSCDLSGDGTRVAIGAAENDGGGTAAGHARVFEYDSEAGSWGQLGADLDGDDPNGNCGDAVRLSPDGSTLAMGCFKHNGVGSNSDPSGLVRVFTWNSDTEQWGQKGSDIIGDSAADWFGTGIGLSTDGTYLCGGASEANGGEVKVFEYTTDWNQMGTDIAREASGDDWGISCDISGDGMTVVAGARSNNGDGGTNSGHMRVYTWDAAVGDWAQKGSDIDGIGGDYRLGRSTAISLDGTRVAAGSHTSDENGNDSGHISVYEWDSDSGDWVDMS